MKTKPLFLFICLLWALCSFQTSENKLLVYIDNYKTEVTEGMYVNCLTINDLSMVMPITEQMKSYDIFKLEFHRFGDDTDIVAATKTFDPKSKDFLKKTGTKESIKLKVLVQESDFSTSDLEPNTLIFPANSTVNTVFCKSHDLKHCSFYLIVKGYNKTGEKTQFNEDVFDKGKDLSAKSVVFKSWIDRKK